MEILRSRRRRLRRIAAPDGQPVGTGWPYPEPPKFEPPAVDEAAARTRVEKAVTGLMPHAFDEATGHVPMNLINSLADQWIDQVDGDFDKYRQQVRREIALAKAALAELDRRHDADRLRLDELAAARRSAFADLSRTEDDVPERTGASRGHTKTSQQQEEAASEPRVVDGEAPKPRSAEPESHVDTESRSPAVDGRESPRPRDDRPRPESGYRAPSLVAGRPLGVFLHLLALVLAAAADLGAFAQVVQLVMANQPALVSYLVVGGLTATVLYLAHSVGIMVRDRVAEQGAARKTWVLLATFGWAAIGAVACWIRLLVTDDDVQASSIALSSDPTAPAAADPTPLPAAILFLALFIGSGLVAAIGAYVTHNPLAGEYRVAWTRYRSAAARAGETAGVRTAVERRLRHLRRALGKARRLRDRERGRRRHFAEELKQHARLLMANHVQDPAFSDALFDPDRLPYANSRNGNGTKSHSNGNASPGA